MANPASGSSEQARPFIALVLQGGGALGAYHVGAYQAMHENGYIPDWIAGVSIGAVNAALIAGNRPEDQLDRLTEFWQIITRPAPWDGAVPDGLRKFYNMSSAWMALMFGQPNFSLPFFTNPYLAPPGSAAAMAFYDNSPLGETLRRLADFDLINARQMRLSLGVTRVSTGDMHFFDNTHAGDLPLGPEHVLASSSIPPMFHGARINGELYWDGGIIDNTPLEIVLEDQDNHPERHTLVFMIDLWDASGPEPRTMDEVLWRQNQIRFASRTDKHIKQVVEKENLRRTISQMSQQLGPHLSSAEPAFEDGTAFQYGNLDIVRITYQPDADQTALSYVDFSRSSIAERRAAGYADMKTALAEAPWFKRHVREATGAPLVAPSAAEPASAALHYVCRRQITSATPGRRQRY